MKKLSKKSLDELAQVMPVISEKSQRECVGGYCYVNENGHILGECSTGGDIIHVVTGSNAEILVSEACSGTIDPSSIGVGMSSLSENGIVNIISGFYLDAYSTGVYIPSSTYISVSNSSTAPAMYIGSNNQLYYNVNIYGSKSQIVESCESVFSYFSGQAGSGDI